MHAQARSRRRIAPRYRFAGWLAILLATFFLSVSPSHAASPYQDTAEAQPQTTEKVSEFGKYAGYSSEKYPKWVLTSQYVEMRDGVRLAVDVVRPSNDGKQAVEDEVPCIWTHSRYHRNQQAFAPQLRSMVDGRPDLQRLVKHGYAVVTVGVRGSGASFGRFEGLFSPSETRDAYEIIDWISNQDWSDGNVGMFGGSYLGMTQYMAASQGHPALKAIFPNVAGFDMYDVLYPGGVFRRDMIQHWDLLTTRLDTVMKAAPVESDTDGSLLNQAITEHQNNWEVLEEYEKAKFRNTVSPEHSWSTHNPVGVLDKVNQHKVPAYHWNGFHDIFVTDSILWYANYDGPQKLGIGPWAHNIFPDRRFMQERSALQEVEQHRWFDYWLKGIDNGIMDEPPVHYSILDRDKKWTWKSTTQWPPASVKDVTWYFAGGKSGSIDSVNDGRLQPEAPQTNEAPDQYDVDLATTTGRASRWDNAVGQGALRYGDLSKNDRRSLTYTSDPLTRDVTLTGHPVATLFVSCSAEDCDFHVLLEEVDADGRSTYVTEGVLRASQRRLAEAPWNNLGLPFHRCFEEDYQPLTPETVTELKLDLHPASVVFNESNRIRVTIMCADKDNTQPLPDADETRISLYHDPLRLSHITLPVE